MKKIMEHRKTKRIGRHTGLVPIEDTFRGGFLQRPFTFDLFRALREPRLDIIEKDNKVIVRAETPGMEEKDIRVRLDNDMITISGEKSAKREIKKEGYYYLEQKANSIQRSARLPEGIAKHKKKMHYKNGVLTVEFSKKGGVTHEKS